MRSKLRNSASTIILVAGVLLLFYPVLSNWVNKTHANFISQEYEEAVAEMTEAQREEMLQAARDYNARLFASSGSSMPTNIVNGNASTEEYESLLDPLQSGVMASLKIPRLDLTLPIYHGSTESVLQSGIGHLEYTSLPVGGVNTHVALSGHRGLPSKQLFTDLDQLEVGDVFYISVLGETLAYQIDQIKTVLPNAVEELAIVEGQDYVTLITCTPYGVNTHRLLVRGTRIPYEEAVEVEDSGFVLTELQKELLLAALILAVFFLIRYLIQRRRKKKQALQEPPKGNNESNTIQSETEDETQTGQEKSKDDPENHNP